MTFRSVVDHALSRNELPLILVFVGLVLALLGRLGCVLLPGQLHVCLAFMELRRFAVSVGNSPLDGLLVLVQGIFQYLVRIG